MQAPCNKPIPVSEEELQCVGCSLPLRHWDNSFGFRHDRLALQEKLCPECDRTLPIVAFATRKDTTDGHATACRECANRKKQENDEAKKKRGLRSFSLWLPRDLHNAVKMISSRHTKETMASFVTRAIRAEVERQVRDIKEKRRILQERS